MKTDAAAGTGRLMDALDFYGIRHAEKNKRISKNNPAPYAYSILTVRTNAGYAHWVLLYENRYYDPEFGVIVGEYPHGKTTPFLEIDAEACSRRGIFDRFDRKEIAAFPKRR